MLSSCAAPIALAALLFSAPLHAQDADAREVAAYLLTEPTLQKVAAAHRQLATAMKADPRVARIAKLKAEKKKLEAKDPLTDAEQKRLDALETEIASAEEALQSPIENAQTLHDVEANIAKQPLLTGALQGAGLAPREYATFMLALVHASLVHGLQKSGMAKELPADAKQHLNPENVKFVAAHEAEIGRMMAELRAVTGEE
jgi:hypothetical protein